MMFFLKDDVGTIVSVICCLFNYNWILALVIFFY
jgi:hypothetical protein